MGMIMPRHSRMNEEITRRIEDFVVTLLLPLFFAYTGLRMNVGLLDRPELWLLTLLLIAIAIVGKLAGAAIAARVAGYDWKASAVIGTLMNTRGLTELIVLNLALDVGAISNALFAMLVIMAVVTTLMAGPLLKLLDPKNEYGTTGRGRVRGCGARRRPGSSRAAGPGALDPGRARDRRRHRRSWSRWPSRWPARLRSRELIIARLVRPTRGASDRRSRRAADREPGARAGSREINEIRERLASDGVRGARRRADLDQPRSRPRPHRRARAGRPGAHRWAPAAVRRGRPAGRRHASCSSRRRATWRCWWPRRQDPIELGPDHPILVPFGGAEHDWAALELGSWLAASTGAPLKLLGAGRSDGRGQVGHADARRRRPARAAGDRHRRPSRSSSPADATASSRRPTGAGLLVLGLSDRWKRGGPRRDPLGDRRRVASRRCCSSGAGPVPGLFAPKENVTQFRWSMVGGPSGLLSGRRRSRQRDDDRRRPDPGRTDRRVPERIGGLTLAGQRKDGGHASRAAVLRVQPTGARRRARPARACRSARIRRGRRRGRSRGRRPRRRPGCGRAAALTRRLHRRRRSACLTTLLSASCTIL